MAQDMTAEKILILPNLTLISWEKNSTNFVIDMDEWVQSVDNFVLLGSHSSSLAAKPNKMNNFYGDTTQRTS